MDFFQGHPDILSGQDLLFQWGGKVWWWQVGRCSEIMTLLWGCWPPFPLEIVKLDPSHCLAPNTAHFSRCHFSMIIIRAVDFLYMPDTMIEEARNVSVNLHGEHGRYFMFSDIVLHQFPWNAHQFFANQNVLLFLFTIFIKTNKPSVDSKKNVVE